MLLLDVSDLLFPRLTDSRRETSVKREAPVKRETSLAMAVLLGQTGQAVTGPHARARAEYLLGAPSRVPRLSGFLSFRMPSAFPTAWRPTTRSRTPTPRTNFTPSSTTTTWPSRASAARCRPGCRSCRKRSCPSRRLKPRRRRLSEGQVPNSLKVTKGLGGTFHQK